MKFDWTKFMDRNNKIAVHCKTKEEAKDFYKEINKHGLKWHDGDSYNFDRDGYMLYNNCYSNKGFRDTYAYYEKNCYTILEWSDYMNDFTKSDLKTGMIVTLRNGALIKLPR